MSVLPTDAKQEDSPFVIFVNSDEAKNEIRPYIVKATYQAHKRTGKG
jgi:hypothetical protein